ncbi:hypothetical protein GCM10023116_03670 [Kistimonas scapharcae]|uniref:DnaT DNA-binding domain-containing protein n=1 Tax=Kistimonas scapharcae TaxID=1036133 RepID=A0ABP8UW24_9GAMM
MDDFLDRITVAMQYDDEDTLSRHLLLLIACLETLNGKCLVSHGDIARLAGVHRITVVRKLRGLVTRNRLYAMSEDGEGQNRKMRYSVVEIRPENGSSKQPLSTQVVATHYNLDKDDVAQGYNLPVNVVAQDYTPNDQIVAVDYSIGQGCSTGLHPRARRSNIYKYKYINKNNIKTINTPFSQTTREKGECEGKTTTSPPAPRARSVRKQENSSRRQTRKHPLPDDFSLTEAMRQWYAQHPDFLLTVDDATGQWRDAMLAKGFQYVDWQAAWRNGMKNQNRWERERQQRQGGSHGRQRPLSSSEIFANLTAEALGKPKPFDSDA